MLATRKDDGGNERRRDASKKHDPKYMEKF
jgi:hypothetical protein